MKVSLLRLLRWIQSKLAFDAWNEYPQFATAKTQGRAALIGTILGCIFGMHLIILANLIILSYNGYNFINISMLIQWTLYILAMCIFHLMEFFMTALYNPNALQADSFLVNHSKEYTAAFIVSFLEFWIRFLICRHWNHFGLSLFGWSMTLVGQIIRSMAMKTCGQYFNHYIQYSNNDNHRLVTYGLYHYFRHPSYVGYFYWAIGTQILLCNPISFSLYVYAAWKFFSKRIPYEESTLLNQYGTMYAEYMKRTWIGIPWIPSKIPTYEKKD